MPAYADTVSVAVASNFANALGVLAEAFAVASGHVVRASAASTGALHSQIVSGAPYEVLLAADTASVDRLVSERLALPQTRFVYATGRLVLWSAQSDRIDAQDTVLARAGTGHVAIANPKTAPYGAAAMSVIQSMGLTQQLKPRLVIGQSVAQAFHFVASGHAEMGFVAWSQVLASGVPPVGSYWLVPPEIHAPIRQEAVVLKTGELNPAAAAFMAYLKSDEAKGLIRSLGYDI